jgi:ribosomal protein S14
VKDKEQKTIEQALRHCQNCGSYRADVERYAGLTVCKACIKKLENSRIKKAQIAFDFVGNQESLF